jgi:hypothetical protein
MNSVCKEDYTARIGGTDLFYSVLILNDHPFRLLVLDYFKKLSNLNDQ